MTGQLNDVLERARKIIGGTDVDPHEALALAAELHRRCYFGAARRMLEKLCERPYFSRELNADPALKLKVAQKRALSTYKDPDLQADLKLKRALEILQQADPLSASRNQETLGQAGAIYRRMWEIDGQERHLETALAYYRRGYQQGIRSDNGYTAINTAFLLDQLADLETVEEQRPAADVYSTAKGRSAEAEKIRTAIVAQLAPLNDDALPTDWWLLVTVGEAYFGLGDYARAEAWLERAAALPDVPDWQMESTARQLALLLHLKQREREARGEAPDPQPLAVLTRFLRGATAPLESVVRGKIGLALSGGGFRASLFHIGVLARLAELDLLRSVEYLSCVSGGSIIGAHYYLEVRRLLQTKTDAEITRQHYIDIVKRVADDFLAGVQRNIRTRVAAEWLTNLKMIFLPNYSRTLRVGELYEREIYSKVQDGNDGKERWLNEVLVHPLGAPEDFRPKEHNWRRAAKVPILVLNATSLNTGHNWQFTATWMGEPPAGIDSEVDANYRLRRMYYTDAPRPHNRIRLGHAVAASSCVPGLFEPLTLADLYERQSDDGKVRPIVRLVDGGVHDNQGIAALLEQGCSVLLVSDASGQMSDEDTPSNGLLGVPLRANSILQARVRVAQYQDIASRRHSGILKGLMFVHLKKDLETRPVDWIDSQDPSEPPSSSPLTRYGVLKKVQRQLAAIRTDLDSFSEAEAYSLMTSAYLMTKHELRDRILGFDASAAKEEQWPFLVVRPQMEDATNARWLMRQLGVADRLAFKVWSLASELRVAASVVAVAVIVGVAALAYRNRDALSAIWSAPPFPDLTWGDVAVRGVIAAVSALGLGTLVKVVRYRKSFQQILIGIAMAFLGFALARLHLHVFDPLFLKQGRVPQPQPDSNLPRDPSVMPGESRQSAT